MKAVRWSKFTDIRPTKKTAGVRPAVSELRNAPGHPVTG